MKHFILVFVLLINSLFFAIYSILGIEYEGAEKSNTFAIICSVGAFIGIVTVFWGEYKNRNPHKRIFMYFVPLLVYLFAYLRIRAYYSIVPNLNHVTLVFLCFSVPAIFIGTYLANSNSILKTRRWFDFFMFVLSFGILLSLPQMIKAENVTIAGSSYQATSYTAAFCFAVNFYELTAWDFQWRFRLKNIVVVFLRIFFLVLQILCTFIGGGRGAAILLIVSFILILWSRIRRLGRGVMIMLLVSFIFLFVLNHLDAFLAERLEYGYERAFSYITERGIDITQTSGRDYVYGEAISSIQKNPTCGYGLLGYLVPTNYTIGYSPHNIFLHILLQGGIILLFLFVVFLLRLTYKYYQLVHRNKQILFLLPVFLYPIIVLLFSGDYLMTPLFWFMISYLVSVRLNPYILLGNKDN